MLSFIHNPKAFPPSILPVLLLDILLYQLSRHCSYRRSKIATCLRMLPPVSFFQLLKLYLEFSRRAPLQILLQFTCRNRSRSPHLHMYMIRCHCSTDKGYLPRHGYLSQKVSAADTNFAAQHPVAVFRERTKVLLDIKYRVAPCTIFSAHRIDILSEVHPTPEVYRLKDGGIRPDAWHLKSLQPSRITGIQ